MRKYKEMRKQATQEIAAAKIGISVRLARRAGLAQALEFVRPGDVLVVWKLDRLGRPLSHLLGSLLCFW